MADPADIRNLAIIGDRRTAALVSHEGTIVWYCPRRFDQPAFFTALLDPEQGGRWSIGPKVSPLARRYLEDSGILETTLAIPAGQLTVTDWMPLGDNLPRGLCRLFSIVPTEIIVSLAGTPDYGRRQLNPRPSGKAVVLDDTHILYASHDLELTETGVMLTLPKGEQGWVFLADAVVDSPSMADIETWLEATLFTWRERAARTTYEGPYEREVAASLRALRLLTFEGNGGVIAAPTTSLPEVIGGARNYDYRYVWLRDAGMIVSALTRAGGDPHEGVRFLDFISSTNQPADNLPLAPFATLDGKAAPAETTLALPGYAKSKPVTVGNGAGEQLQLDAYGNVLLAAKLLYSHLDDRRHWTLIERLADFLCDHWQQPDHGLWEEQEPRQYTSSKVVVACGLEFIADYNENALQTSRWREAAGDIRRYVAKHCLTSEGAYAAVAGGEAVDVSAALFPVWDYTSAESPEMLATIAVLERDSAEGFLYRRHLTEFDAREEGAFLAGTLWVAQYWITRGDLRRSQQIINAVLECANDLYLFAEEADPHSKRMLGNFPQSFVHAAFVGVIVDLKTALATS